VPNFVYKICSITGYNSQAAAVPESADDLRDGFVHLSTASQVAGSLARHFAHLPEVVVLRIDAALLDPARLRYEPSRGGALFPHYHGVIPTRAVSAAQAVVRQGDQWLLPEGLLL